MRHGTSYHIFSFSFPLVIAVVSVFEVVCVSSCRSFSWIVLMGLISQRLVEREWMRSHTACRKNFLYWCLDYIATYELIFLLDTFRLFSRSINYFTFFNLHLETHHCPIHSIIIYKPLTYFPLIHGESLDLPNLISLASIPAATPN